MKAPTALLVVICLIAAASTATGQNPATILPYDDAAVSLLRSIYLEQGKEPLTAASPYSVDELRIMLDQIDPNTLSEAGTRAYEAVKARIQTRPAAAPMELKLAAHPFASLEGSVNTAPPGETQWEAGYNQRKAMFGIPTEAWIGDAGYADMDLALRQNPDGVNPLLVPNNYLNWSLDTDVYDMNIPQRAFAAVGGQDWSFTIGRDRFSWGIAQTGDLMLSDAPHFQEFARFTLSWPNLQYTALWIMLYSDLDAAYRLPPWGTPAIYNSPPRNFFIHRLDFSLFDRVSIALNEGILIGGIQPDLVYFNPLIIFHDLFRWGHASSILSLEASANPWRYFEIYGQAAYNQIQTPYEIIRYGMGAADTPNASAYLGGVRVRVPAWLGYADAGAEAVFVGPWMYIRENQLISYEWWRWMNSNVTGSPQWVGAPLGYPTGPDAIVFAGWAGFDVPGLFRAGVDFKQTRKGQQDFDTPYAEDAAAVALMTPTGTPEIRNVLHLGGQYDVLPFLRLGADLYWIGVQNFEHAPGVSVTDFQATVSVTLHTDL